MSPAVAHVRSGGGTPGVFTGAVAVPGQQSVLAYWTPARMRSALPASLRVSGARPVLRPATDRRQGKPGSVPGGLPTGGGPVAGVRSATTALMPRSFPYPYPFDSFTPPQSKWATDPYDVNGKLFFESGGKAYVCSATAVASASGIAKENEIWTAGHCLTQHGVLDSSAVFVPAYNGNVKNSDPFGKFVWTGRYSVRAAWRTHNDSSQDQAAMLVGPSSTTGKTLGQSVGWAGFAYNRSVNQQFIAFGYPAGKPYNGKNLVENIAATAAQDTKMGAARTKPIAIGDPMTGGSSGGAWFIGWSDRLPGLIDGVNSYGYDSQPNVMFSPYQDTVANEVRCFGKTGC